MDVSNRVFGLDLLRAFAIFFVVYGHAGNVLPNSIPKDIYQIPVFDGVGIFFVLSGFLIGRILLRTVNHEGFDGAMLRQFWIRRWFRTLPNYYLVLTLLIISTYLISDPINPIPASIGYFFVFFQNFAWPHPEFFGEAWSLAVEEWFYLCIPIPIYLSTKLPNIDRRRIVIFCIFSVILFSTAYRIFYAYQLGSSGAVESQNQLHMHVIARLDSLMFGVLGAYLNLYYRRVWDQIGPYIIAPGIFILIFDRYMHLTESSLFYLHYISLSITSIAILLLLPKLSNWYAKPNPFVNIVTFISVTSYSMYLLNQALILETLLPVLMPKLMYYFWRFSEYTDVIVYSLFWLFTVTGSYVLYRYFEQPMMSLRERWSIDRHAPAKTFGSRTGRHEEIDPAFTTASALNSTKSRSR